MGVRADILALGRKVFPGTTYRVRTRMRCPSVQRGTRWLRDRSRIGLVAELVVDGVVEARGASDNTDMRALRNLLHVLRALDLWGL